MSRSSASKRLAVPHCAGAAIAPYWVPPAPSEASETQEHPRPEAAPSSSWSCAVHPWPAGAVPCTGWQGPSLHPRGYAVAAPPAGPRAGTGPPSPLGAGNQVCRAFGCVRWRRHWQQWHLVAATHLIINLFFLSLQKLAAEINT